MARLLTLCVLQLFLQIGFGSEYTPVLQIPQGKLVGVETKRGDLRQYLGIPYGTVDERFQGGGTSNGQGTNNGHLILILDKEAGPPPRWLGVYNASDTSVICPQFHERLGLPMGTEDCLVLNIYTPGQGGKRLYPVMVFIHGGLYKSGSNNHYLYNPKLLVKKGVIVVTINYRLDAFGFLCLRINGAPGNIGLKDQVAALEWVKDNIKYFGGNPDSVTIFGQSAGSSSVGYHILSPASKGLFKRAIMESGSTLTPFAFASDPIEKASLVASQLGYNTKNPYELLKIFKSATKNEIILASAATPTNETSENIFRPCIEKPMTSVTPFLTMEPREILDSGLYNKVSMIIGYNDKEGLFYLPQINQNTYQTLNYNFAAFLPENLYFSSIRERKRVADRVKAFYFGNKTINEDSKDSLVDLLSDIMFHYPAVSETEYFLNHNHLPIYNYYFKYDSYRNLAKISAGLQDEKGAAHEDELYYLFQPIIMWAVPLIRHDVKVVGRMTSMWTNFAKFGNPTALKSQALDINWDPSDANDLKYLAIDTDLTMESLPNPERIEFWRNIYSTQQV